MKRGVLSQPRGQDLVEYAITLPLALILVFAIIDVGRMVYYYSAMQNAVREGARYGSVHPDEADLETTICDRVASRAIGVKLTCNPDEDIVVNYAAGTITVNVSFAYPLMTPLVGAIFGLETINLSTGSTMELEYIPQ